MLPNRSSAQRRRVYKSFGGDETQDPIFLNLFFSVVHRGGPEVVPRWSRGGPEVVPRWLETPPAMIPNVTKMKLRHIDRDMGCDHYQRAILFGMGPREFVCVYLCGLCCSARDFRCCFDVGVICPCVLRPRNVVARPDQGFGVRLHL